MDFYWKEDNKRIFLRNDELDISYQVERVDNNFVVVSTSFGLTEIALEQIENNTELSKTLETLKKTYPEYYL